MTATWATIAGLTVVAVAIKAGCAVLAGRGELSPRRLAVIAAMPPALLGGLIAAETFAADGQLRVDERIAGLAAAAAALALRAPMVVVVAAAASVTALARALG